jgi:hypothetical protein
MWLRLRHKQIDRQTDRQTDTRPRGPAIEINGLGGVIWVWILG